jgi:hypothetical protein
VLEHLELLQRMEAAAASATKKPGSSGAAKPAASASHRFSWVQHSTSAAAALSDGLLSLDSEDGGSEGDRLMAAVAALPPHLLTESQQAAVILQAWESAAHAKPPGFDAAAQLTLPGLAGALLCVCIAQACCTTTDGCCFLRVHLLSALSQPANPPPDAPPHTTLLPRLALPARRGGGRVSWRLAAAQLERRESRFIPGAAAGSRRRLRQRQ